MIIGIGTVLDYCNTMTTTSTPIDLDVQALSCLLAGIDVDNNVFNEVDIAVFCTGRFVVNEACLLLSLVQYIVQCLL